MNFSQRLTELRKNAHLSQSELAKKIGVSKGTISNYEQGVREPSFENEEALADYFNVSLDYLRGADNVTTVLVGSEGHKLLCDFNDLTKENKERLLGYIEALKEMQ